MKKFLALILAVCVIFAVGISYLNFTDREKVISQFEQALPQPDSELEASEAEAEVEAIPEDIPEAVEYKGVDIEAIRALHEDDEVVMTVNGEDVKWGEYFYCLSSQISQVEQIFQMLAMYYGEQGDWNDVADPNTGESYANVVNFNAEAMLRQMLAIENKADELGVELSEEELAALEEQKNADKLSLCGEGASDEDFFAALAVQGLNKDFYERISKLNLLYAKNHDVLYGEDGELVEDETVSLWLADQGYMRANHILFMSIDEATGEALEQAAIDEKLEIARKIIDEISAIEDPEERKTRFEELKAEYCEDTGKEAYPEGYTFTSGTMVVEFEEAAKALEAYEISEPVQSKYGYHVMLGLPLEADGAVSTGDGSVSGRQLYIAEQYEKIMQEEMDSAEVVYVEGFETVDIPAYLNK